MKYLSWILIFSGFGLLIFIFFPVAKEEIKYNLDKAAHVKYVIGTEQLNSFEKPLTPPNTDFSIVIPKIGAVAPVIDNVDPADPKKYLSALRRGVAHAEGTGNPGEEGNVYLFAHSTDAFWNVSSYNAVFYLIGKLNPGDEIDIFFEGNVHKYIVYDKKVVDPNSSQYFLPPAEALAKAGGKMLTLQTCYPPGTALKRLIVLAKEE